MSQLGLVVQYLRRISVPSEADDMSDGRLLERFILQRDETAFATLVRRHGPMVIGVCRRILPNVHDIEDAFQATFLVLLRRAPSLRHRHLLANWLYGVAYRTALKARSKALRKNDDKTPLTRVPANDVAAADWHDTRAVLDEEVDRLSDIYRTPFILCYLQGLTNDEAARRLGCPTGTILSRLARAREKLRARLTRRGVTLSAGALAATVPAPLIAATVHSGRAFIGGGAHGAISTGILVLVQEVSKALVVAKVKLSAIVVAIAAVSTGASALAGQAFWRPAPVQAALQGETTPEDPPGTKVQEPIDKSEWAKKLADLTNADWRQAFQAGLELASLPPDDGFDILKDNWDKVDNVDARQQLLKAWYYQMPYPLHARNHPRLLSALDLGMRDKSADVRKWARGFLQQVAFQSFEEADEPYDKWYRANREKKVDAVVADAVSRFTADLAGAEKAEAQQKIKLLADNWLTFRDVAAARQAAIDAKLPAILEKSITGSDTKLAEQALRAIAHVNPGEEYLRRVVVPMLAASKPIGVRVAAISAFHGQRGAFARDQLLRIVQDSLSEDEGSFRSLVWGAAQILGSMGDPKAIPTLIGVIDADNTYDTVYGIGYFALTPLTGVDYNENHNGAWWKQWWETNKEKYPADVRDEPIPRLEKKLKLANPLQDVAEVPSQRLRADGDENKSYFLIGLDPNRKPPADGCRLLVVLPGGDGSADFHPFCRRLHKHALDEKWLIAQLVAPKWDAKQFDRVVWPTEGLRYPGARFTTEGFIDAVIKDAGSKAKINPQCVFLLGWSSGGPPCYAATLRPGSAVQGAFIAMSVFKTEQLPALENAKAKTFYLLQSPEDKVTPLRFAEAADKSLSAAGAKTHLQRYEGGHGWHGDMWDMIRDGVAWLETNRPSSPGK
jgi:RNA polymerase sigma factor (sigma-70 family)